MLFVRTIFLLLFLGGSLAFAQQSNSTTGEDNNNNKPMTIQTMNEIVKRLDPQVQISSNGRAMVLTISNVQVTVITDPERNRMRAFAAVSELDGVNSQQLYRMLQANFDSALDARYSIAKEFVLSAFIHPLAELKRRQFIEGLGQVVNLVKTFGTTYTSGGMTFGGGDSRQLHRKLIEDLLKKGDTI